MSVPGRAPDGEGGARPTRWEPTGDEAVDWLMAHAARSLRHGDLDAAAPYLERALALAPDRATRVAAHLALGRSRRAREEHGSATHHFRQAAELAPRRADVLYELGLSQAEQENARAAAETLRAAAGLAPEEPEVLRALGVSLASLGEDREADELLRRAHAAAPEDVRVLESVAAHHLKMGRFSLCGEIVKRATELAPENRLVRRLAKEASYLVELAAQAPAREAPSPRPFLRVALGGRAGDVERLFSQAMVAAGFSESQVVNARDLWRDYRRLRRPRVRRPAVHAAAIEYLVARLDFRDGSSRDDVARRHGVAVGDLSRAYEDMVSVLDVAVFDQRYSTQPHPVEQVTLEAADGGLDAEEIFRALVEDEYREYEEAYDSGGALVPRLARDEFEDASIEYGSLLTREMMGLTLGKRDRRRRRELERLLLVT